MLPRFCHCYQEPVLVGVFTKIIIPKTQWEREPRHSSHYSEILMFSVTAKIRNLQDYHLRLTNGIVPLPTGLDIANTLKHFSQTLLGTFGFKKLILYQDCSYPVLKDVPQYPLEMLKQRTEETVRMQLFPNLDYNALFNVVVQLIDVAPMVQLGVQGQNDTLGQAILQTIACLLPFLEHEHIDTLPYIVATSLGTFPSSLHKDIIDLLCHYLLPFTLYLMAFYNDNVLFLLDNCDQCPDKAAYAMQSVSAVLMMVFQYTSSSEYHCQILESVMCYKRDAIKDLLCVIAYGTVEARKVGMNLLVYYWPHVNPTLYDRRNVNFNFNGYKIPGCRSEMCSVNNTGMCADAAKVCFDHSVGISLAPENPPPLFLCQECSSRLQSEQPTASEHLYDVSLPIIKAGTTCENKNCRSQGPDKVLNAVICFHSECASYNGNRPIRYCSQCHSIRHNNRRGLDHVFHKSIQTPDTSDTELLNYHVEAVVSALLEAEPLATRGGTKDVLDQQTRLRLFTDGEFTDPIPIEERRLLGRFGIWLLVGFFNPEDDMLKDVLSRLLSALFQWFNTTAYLGNDPSANALERLKVDFVCPWLKRVVKGNFETFVTCLLPHPPDYARVGGHWYGLIIAKKQKLSLSHITPPICLLLLISSRTFHLREGFNRLFCLVPYEVISPEIWSQIMPHWMEAMASEVPEEEMGELKIILRYNILEYFLHLPNTLQTKTKVMDPEMNPLGFEARQMYQFIAVRFHQTSHKVKEQALKWLQVLSKLEIVIPLYFIFSIFREGIRPKTDKVPKRGSVSQSADTKDVISAICPEDSPQASIDLSDDEENIQLHTEQQSDSELMLSSFIFMLDIILKQLELQEVEQHKGLHTLVAKDAMVLLHNMVAMPWPGTHTCQQSQDCQFCEMAVLWYQLALEIVQKLAPENSALAPDVILSPDGEFGGKGFLEGAAKQELKDSKAAVSPKSESRGLEGIIVNMPQVCIMSSQILTATVETISDFDMGPIMPPTHTATAASIERPTSLNKSAVARQVTITDTETASATAQISSTPLLLENTADVNDKRENWSTTLGDFQFSIEELPPFLKFTYELLKAKDPEVMHNMLKCLRIMFLHGEVFMKASKENRGFVIWCQENLILKKNIEGNLDNFIRKLGRIHEALMKHENNYAAGSKTLYASLGSKMTYKRTMSAPGGLHAKGNDKGYWRQSSAPTLKRKGSRHGVEGYIHGLLGGDDSHLLGIFHRIIEIEEADKETMHLLTFLFMQFLSRYNRGPIPSENSKALARTQNVLLRHLNMLLGHNPQDKTFFIPPSRMRSSPVFNSFISALPQVLDQNFRVGGTLLPMSLTILQYCPAPSKNAGSRYPSYSLWYLEPHVRRSWLMSLIVVLYKYEYGQSPLSTQVQSVIRIILNTLNYQEHKCRPLPSTLILDEPIGRSRADISRVNIGNAAGDLEHITEHETPPITPLSTHNVSPSFSSTREARKSVSSISSVKQQKKGTSGGVSESFDMMSSTDEPDDIEPELAAIPESPRLISSSDVVYIYNSTALISYSSNCAFKELVEQPRITAVVHSADEFQTIDQLQSILPVVISESPKIVHSNSGSAPLSASSEKSKSIGWFIGSSGTASEGDNKSSSSGGSTSSKSGVTVAKSAGGEFPWHLSVQAALQIAKIPAPPLERLLPVGFNAPPLSPTVKSVPRISNNGGHGSPYESPESPMSRMDGMITIGPTFRIDEGEINEALQPERQHAHVDRLLSLGAQGSDKPYKHEEHGKGLHKAEGAGNVSPKKLVKQPRVCDSDVFDGTQQRDEGMEKRGAGDHDAGKSVGFAYERFSLETRSNVESSGQPSRYVLQNLRQSCLRVGEECVQERCGDCGVLLESYTNDELGLCIVALETFIHREPSVAAPFMPEILKVVTSFPNCKYIVGFRIALKPLFPWQVEGSSYFPGAVSSVAHQFLRCVLHQLAPYGVFVQLFQTKFPEKVKVDLFKSISLSLADFAALNPVAPLQMLFETLNARKSIVMDTVAPIIENLATYMECLPLEAASATWSAVIPLSEAFLRKIMPLMQNLTGVDGILRTMACLMRLPGISAFKSILDPFSKILGFVLGNLGLKYNTLVELCHLCHRGFLREREKLLLTRIAILELVQALKFKSNIPDSNFLTLVTFALQDAGGSLAPFVGTDDFPKFPTCEPSNAPTTGAAECMRQHLTDSLEFLADFHSLSKIKSNYKGNGCGLNEDTLGGVIKGGISQFIALEISRGNSRENRAIGRHLPWLYNPPSAIQQGPKEFLDCVAHIRVLSWLLLGALTHTAMFGPTSNVACVPIPLEASCHVADHVHVIMTGFAEQSKASVLHMSSLFHAFILCQVWTVYLEQVGPAAQTSNSSDPANVSTNILTDFWGKVTPAILQLISHSKVLAEMVNLHFLSLLESLLECNSSVFSRLLPLWNPVLFAHHGQLPAHVQVRLQTCLGYPPPDFLLQEAPSATAATTGMNPGHHHQHHHHDILEFPSPTCGPIHNLLLLKWVQRLQFKMGQIELQSSAATQFYPL
ncbi:Protein unc-79 [Orchesella cincta]|uniref:Protein unc-79 n=1 Tax=Orchesella cincta TaxID=48709 RepID=A0A1D2NH93_ORCCI|nr:Protein unc-79 [Orchesella cincta]